MKKEVYGTRTQDEKKREDRMRINMNERNLS
jgi:hypothetical protein